MPKKKLIKSFDGAPGTPSSARVHCQGSTLGFLVRVGSVGWVPSMLHSVVLGTGNASFRVGLTIRSGNSE